MWSFASNCIGSIGLKKSSREPSRASSECSDDERSGVSAEEGLECPICWESFNIVENVPYVLWCGHTLCQNCVLGLQSAVLKLPAQEIRLPFFISCPWCHMLSFRLVYGGVLKFPRKNFFLLWMVESLNGDRTMHGSSSYVENQSVCSPKCSLVQGSQTGNCITRRVVHNHPPERPGSFRDDVSSRRGRHLFSLHKSLDFFIHCTSKFPFVLILLLIVFFAIPGSIIILALYLLVTVIFAIPSFLVLYFAYPMLDRLVREITS